MTAADLDQQIAEIRSQLTDLDASRPTLEDEHRWTEIAALEPQRESLGRKLAALQTERAAQAEQEREAQHADLGRRIVDEVPTFDNGVFAALETVEKAISELGEANAARRQFIAWASETLRGAGDGQGIIASGPVVAIRQAGQVTRIENNSREIVTELCRILEPVVRSVGGEDVRLANELQARIRGGNRLARP